MKIIEGIKQKGRPFKIPDANRDDLPEFFKEMGYKVGVEIGTDKGRYAERYGKAGLKLFCVDPWKYYEDYAHQQGQERLDVICEATKERLKPYDITIIRKTSMEALADFEDESLDFVYIDGHHGFKYVTEDIYEWSKKVKKGGVISGHDYALGAHEGLRDPFVLHVKYVIDAYTKAFHIDWFLLGSDEKKEGEKRDTFRSWLWFKQ